MPNKTITLQVKAEFKELKKEFADFQSLLTNLPKVINDTRISLENLEAKQSGILEGLRQTLDEYVQILDRLSSARSLPSPSNITPEADTENPNDIETTLQNIEVEKQKIIEIRQEIEDVYISSIRKIERFELESIDKRTNKYNVLIGRIQEALDKLTQFNQFQEQLREENQRRIRNDQPPLATPTTFAPEFFHTGGLVSATKSAQAGMARALGLKADEVPAVLQKGEFVVRQSMASQFRPILEAINSGITARAQSLSPSPAGNINTNNTRHTTNVIERAEIIYPAGETNPDQLLSSLENYNRSRWRDMRF